jgi:hypothetical protein
MLYGCLHSLCLTQLQEDRNMFLCNQEAHHGAAECTGCFGALEQAGCKSSALKVGLRVDTLPACASAAVVDVV